MARSPGPTYDEEDVSLIDDVIYPDLENPLATLRKERTNRRRSQALIQARTGEHEARTVYEIATAQQLEAWMIAAPQEVFDMLESLRKQRDMGIELSELCDTHDVDMKAAEATIRRQRLAIRALEDQPRSLREGSPFSQSGGRRSQKQPDPDQLDDGTKPTWKEWYPRMKAKLRVNKDHFDDEESKISYVLSRLCGKAAGYTNARSPFDDSENPYVTSDEVLKDLESIFSDPDERNKNERAFTLLFQGAQKFNEFYSDFRYYSSSLGYNENTLIYQLKEKINPRLRDRLISYHPCKTLTEYRDYLQTIDNDQRAEYKRKIREGRIKEISREDTPKVHKKVSFQPTSSSPSPIGAPPSYTRAAPINPQRIKDESESNCFLCHQPGHNAADCPISSSRQATPQRQATPAYVPPFRREQSVHDVEVDVTGSGSDSDSSHLN